MPRNRPALWRRHQGTGESAVRERVTWEKELAAHFNKFKRYPAERSVQAAEVIVSFALDRPGTSSRRGW